MKKLLSVLLALTMCLSVMTFTVSAAVLPGTIEKPTTPKAALDNDVPDAYIDFTDEIIVSFGVPDSILSLRELSNVTITVQMDWSINSEEDWKCTGVDDWWKPDYVHWSEKPYGQSVGNIIEGEKVQRVSVFRSNYSAPKNGGYEHICYGLEGADGYLNLTDNTIYMKLRFRVSSGDEVVYSDWTDVFTIGNEVDEEVIISSDWAKEELAKADELGLIPEILDGADLTADITRAEFAAVSVKVYEALSGTPALPAVANPFTDTADPEILKAYNIGAVNGTSATTYSPNDLLNREQAATMLTRVFKRVTLPGWTLATDSQFTLPYEKPTAFADDKDISDWAKDSVYFMAANNIINGVGNNKFAPKNITTEEQAQGYANATREQALIIAMRMVENLKK